VAWALAASCFDQPLVVGPAGIVAVVVGPDTTALRLGQQARLTAAPLDSSAAFLPRQPITWSTSAPGVASVDQDGLVTGLAPGNATITADVGGIQGTALVVVDLAPSIGLSRAAVPLSVTAGQNAPPDSVIVSNAGGFTLAGLSLDAVTYPAGPTDWLSVTLTADTAPARLLLMPATAALTAAGVYRAIVPVVSVDADNSPRGVEVTLTVTAAPPSDPAITVDDANIVASAAGDQADTRAVVTVTLADAFGNPRVGDIVTFTPDDGNDHWRVSTANPTASNVDTTDAAGVAQRVFFSTFAEPKVLTATIPGAGDKTVGATVRAAAPASVVASAGNNQTARVSEAVATDPSFTVTDAFGNPVGGQSVSFSAAGGGAVSPSSGATNVSGVVTVSSWTMGAGGTENGDGTFVNTLTATAGSASADVVASGIFTWSGDVSPIVTTSCLGCHAAFTGPAALVNVMPTFAPCNATGPVRVVAGNAAGSLFYRKVSLAGDAPLNCGGFMPGASGLGNTVNDPDLKIIRAWINNGAQNN
jgi:hypothetical protein